MKVQITWCHVLYLKECVKRHRILIMHFSEHFSKIISFIEAYDLKSVLLFLSLLPQNYRLSPF